MHINGRLRRWYHVIPELTRRRLGHLHLGLTVALIIFFPFLHLVSIFIVFIIIGHDLEDLNGGAFTARIVWWMVLLLVNLKRGRRRLLFERHATSTFPLVGGVTSGRRLGNGRPTFTSFLTGGALEDLHYQLLLLRWCAAKQEAVLVLVQGLGDLLTDHVQVMLQHVRCCAHIDNRLFMRSEGTCLEWLGDAVFLVFEEGCGRGMGLGLL